MTINLTEFIGKPWIYRVNDCWSVYKEASLKLFGIEVSEIEVPHISNLAESIRIFDEGTQSSEWQRIEYPEAGCAAIFRNKRGHPIHIELYIEKNSILHCEGNERCPGQTRYEQIRELQKRYHIIEFYRHVHSKNCT